MILPPLPSERAAQIYGLKVLEHNINYNSNNITKFIILSKQQCQNPKADKISVVISIEHKAGSLASILDLFAKSKLNLTNIQSRPDATNPFEYIFFLDFEGSMADENTRQTVGVLKSKCTKFKYLGNYI